MTVSCVWCRKDFQTEQRIVQLDLNEMTTKQVCIKKEKMYDIINKDLWIS